MLILSIVMAAFAPVMTTRSKVDLSSPWQWASNNSDIFYGMGNNQTAMIGQRQVSDTDPQSRLVINAPAGSHHILFKKDGTMLGQLNLEDTNLTLGNGSINGARNTVIGRDAYVSGTNSSSDNVAIGHESLQENTSGANNTAVGQSSLESNTSGGFNTAIGSGTLQNSSTATHNTAVGAYALQANTTGNSNAAIGADSLFNNTTGEKNIAVGYKAMESNTEGSYNVASGLDSLRHNTIGSYNSSYGAGSLQNNTTATHNTALGSYSMQANTTGSSNIAVGADALFSNTTAHNNIAIGKSALYNNNANSNVAIGLNTMYNAKTASSSIAIGEESLYNSNGSDNVSIGYHAMHKNTNGVENVAIGHNAFSASVDNNSYNVVIGSNAGIASSGTGMIIVGYDADATSTHSIAIGYQTRAMSGSAIAMGSTASVPGVPSQRTTAEGARSIAIGDGSYAKAEDSVAIGSGALTKGLYSVAVGRYACRGAVGANKICIGANSGPKDMRSAEATDDQERIYIGSKSKYNDGDAVLEIHNVEDKWAQDGKSGSAVVINGGLVVHGPIFAWMERGGILPEDKRYIWSYIDSAATHTFGSSSIESTAKWRTVGPLGYPVLSSDRRLKYVGTENKSGLEKIRQLKVFNYTFKKDKEKTPHVGVIAQDLQKIFPDAVTKGDGGFLRIRMEDMFYALVNAVKELDAKITELTNQVKILQEQNKYIIKQNKQIEVRLKALEAKK